MTERTASTILPIDLNGSIATLAADRCDDPPDNRSQSPATMRWHSQLIAERTVAEDPWEPAGIALERAKRAGARLHHDHDGYMLTFVVEATTVAQATRLAMSSWARLYEACKLPDWPVTDLIVRNERSTASAQATHQGQCHAQHGH